MTKFMSRKAFRGLILFLLSLSSCLFYWPLKSLLLDLLSACSLPSVFNLNCLSVSEHIHAYSFNTILVLTVATVLFLALSSLNSFTGGIWTELSKGKAQKTVFFSISHQFPVFLLSYSFHFLDSNLHSFSLGLDHHHC